MWFGVIVMLLGLAAGDPPIADEVRFVVDIPEDAVPGSTVYVLEKPEHGEVFYLLETQRVPFRINENTREVILTDKLDYELRSKYVLLIEKETGFGKSPIQIFVEVTDVNDNSPKIRVHNLEESEADLSVVEHSPLGTIVGLVLVDDVDSGANGAVECALNSISFSLIPLYAGQVYRVATARHLDRERHSRHHVRLTCHDNGTPPRSASKEVNIDVIDVNDNAPTFLQNVFEVTVLENHGIGLKLLTVSAIDRDEGINGRILYFLNGAANGLFEIDRNTGVIRTRAKLDREQESRYVLSVVARDDGEPSFSSSATVMVNVKDQNDNPPFVFPTRFTVNSDADVGAVVGKVVGHDMDEGKNAKITFSFFTDHVHFKIDGNGTISVRSSLKDVAGQEIEVDVKAEDGGTPTRSTRTAINIFVTP